MPIIKRFPIAVTVIIGLLLVNNILFANGVYTKKYVQAQAALSIMTRIVYTAESTEGFNPNETPILFIGALSDSEIDWRFPGFEPYSGVGLWSDTAFTYEQTYYGYLSHILGYPIPACPGEKKERIQAAVERLNLPAFPQEGYCRMVENCLVIKLSE